MIKSGTGNIFDSEADALVNTVNCVGVMGKGLALQFRRRFPENYKSYVHACKTGDVQPGKMFVFEQASKALPRYIINFPTKRHWREPAKIEDLRQGMQALIDEIKKRHIRSVAVPPLGCGNGGLSWEEVRPIIVDGLSQLSDVEVTLFEPSTAFSNERQESTAKELLTRSRAMLLRIFAQYRGVGYSLTPIEVQKLAYFLQEAGEQLQLKYVKHQYGPYADNLRFVLDRLGDSYLERVKEGNRTDFNVRANALAEAENFLGEDSEASKRVSKVEQLIQGFETPYGLELLASVHWLISRENSSDLKSIEHGMKNWNSRKAKIFDAYHVSKAYEKVQMSDFMP